MPESLRQVIYVSNHSPNITQGDIDDMVAKARLHNRQHDISGLLVSVNLNFFQLFEGPPDFIDALYAKIRADERHREVRTIILRDITEKSLPSWDMVYITASSVGQTKDIEYVLNRYAKKQAFRKQDQLGIYLILLGLSEKY